MPKNKPPFLQPPISTFCHAINRLQKNARSASDIEIGILSNTKLLQDVSNELGLQNSNFNPSTTECIEFFKFKGPIEVVSGLGNNGISDFDLQHFQVYLDVDYKTDQSISFDLVFSTLRKLGVYFDQSYSTEIAGAVNERRIFLAPSKWPIAASELIYNLPRRDFYAKSLVEKLLFNMFPATDENVLFSMLDADMFDDVATLCDWLMQYENVVSSNPDLVEIPNNLI